jgi:SAM-dependent methyltransferase
MDASMREPADPQAYADAVFRRLVGGFEMLSIYLGDRLGLYDALRAGPATAGELAARAGITPRYATEWLEQQAVAGLLDVDDVTASSPRFVLPAAAAEVLTDPLALTYSAPFARLLMAAASRLPELLEAYRSGGGVPWAAFGADARDAQGDANRPWFESRLADSLARVDAVDAVLSRPGARIADVGCGHGWSTVALARAYPAASVSGFDLDEPSLVAARTHAAGLANASFARLPAEDLATRGEMFDAAFVFEALHDMPDPVGVLRALHAAVRPDGIVIVMDEAVADEFAPNGDEIERIMYGYSLFICLPDSLSTPGSAATGTVMRHATLGAYARRAGFRDAVVLPIEGFAAFRFYALER